LEEKNFKLLEPNMTTIYLLEQGRLGNQLFQLLAARIFDRHAKIIMIGGVDLNRYFLSFKGVSQIYHKSHPAFFLWSLSWLVRKFAHYGLIGYVQESFNSQKHQLFHYKGIFSRHIFFDGFHQAGRSLSSDLADFFQINERLARKARNLIKSAFPDKENIFFIHVRRGDYLIWPSVDFPAVLPAEFYLHQIERIRGENPGASFIVLSDDCEYCRNIFIQVRDLKIIDSDQITDFAIMSQCIGGGIISASTFSWWASYILKLNNPNAVIIAPKYWAGHQVKKWIPKFIESDWIEYVEF
jgi:hypothetical protein